MNWAQLIIAIAAIWGAVLSTYTDIRNFIKEKWRIKVELSYGLLTHDPQLSKMLLLKAVNIGNQTVNLIIL
ncbi:MAG: hypothetical protein ACTSPV_18760 [Candidatus Hodarchaeales archaeon]